MGVIWELIKALSNNQDDNAKIKQEKEMNEYDLEDWQKDLVQEGKNGPWNFEEDGGQEEDDHYSEDDV